MSTGVNAHSNSGYRGKKPKDFSHPSVVALIRQTGGGVDPYEIVRARCRELATWAKLSMPQWIGPPYCPFQLASKMGIKVLKVSHDIGAEARIFGTSAGVRIEYRPDLVTTEERLRFSIFHEIAHTVFRDCYEHTRHSNLERSEPTEAEKEFERMCDAGAGELLLPHEDITRDLSLIGLNLSDVCTLKRRYKASPEAAMRRCLDLTPHSRAAVFLGKNEDQVSVKYYWKSTSFDSFIPPGFVPPADSIVHAHPVHQTETPTPDLPRLEKWRANGRISVFQVQVVALPQFQHLPDAPKFMALVAQ